MDDPTQFVAQTHHAISASLGVAATGVSILKERLTSRLLAQEAAQGVPAAGARKTLKDAVQLADQAYVAVEELMAKTQLSIPTEKLLRANFVKDPMAITVGISSGRLKGNFGFDGKLIKAFAEGVHPPSAEDKKAADQSAAPDVIGGQAVSTASGLGKLGIELAVTHVHVTAPSDEAGQYLEVSTNVTGDALVVGGLGKGITALLKNFYPDIGDKALALSLSSVAGEIKKMGLDGSRTVKLVGKFHKPAEPLKGPFNLQFLRLQTGAQDGVSVTVPIPIVVDGGVSAVKLGGGVINKYEDPVAQWFQSDMPYMRLKYSWLKELMEKSSDTTLGARNPGAATDTLRENFRATPQATTAFFGSADLVPHLIDQWREFMVDAKAPHALSQEDLQSKVQTNYFYNFLLEPFASATRVFHKFERNQAGSTVKLHPDESHHLESILLMSSAGLTAQTHPNDVTGLLRGQDMTPHWPPGLPWSDERWAAAKAHVQGLNTTEGRANYFLSGEGRPVFDAMFEIVRFYNEIHGNAQKFAFNTPGIKECLGGGLAKEATEGKKPHVWDKLIYSKAQRDIRGRTNEELRAMGDQPRAQRELASREQQRQKLIQKQHGGTLPISTRLHQFGKTALSTLHDLPLGSIKSGSEASHDIEVTSTDGHHGLVNQLVRSSDAVRAALLQSGDIISTPDNHNNCLIHALLLGAQPGLAQRPELLRQWGHWFRQDMINHPDDPAWVNDLAVRDPDTQEVVGNRQIPADQRYVGFLVQRINAAVRDGRLGQRAQELGAVRVFQPWSRTEGDAPDAYQTIQNPSAQLQAANSTLMVERESGGWVFGDTTRNTHSASRAREVNLLQTVLSPQSGHFDVFRP